MVKGLLGVREVGSGEETEFLKNGQTFPQRRN